MIKLLRINLKYFVLCLVISFGIVPSTYASEIQVEVVYLAADAIYINAGLLSGIQNGDLGEVKRSGEVIARLEVIYVADKNASCKILESSDTIHKGDRATILIDDTILAPESPQATTSPLNTLQQDQKESNRSEPISFDTGKDKTVEQRIRGKIGLQYYMQNDLDERNYDYSMPSLTGSLRIDHVFQSDYSANVRFRARRYYRDYETSYSSSDWNNRIYEVSFSYNNELNPMSWSFGRVLSRNISGIGTLDGATIEYRLRNNLKSGLFAGGQPDLENTSPQFNETKAGAYLAYENNVSSSLYTSGTLALAGKYNSGEINREFIYEQINLNYGGVWGVYQSSEVGLNRGWQKEIEGSTLSLSNILINLRYTPNRKLSAYLGYDTRRLVRTWETKETPDSLFDDSYREGMRAGVAYRFPQRIYLSLRGGIRKAGNDNNSTNTYAFSLGQHDVLQSGIRVEVTSNFYDNSYSNGFQPSFRIDRMFFNRFHTAIQIGQNNYELASTGGTITNSWLKISMDSRLSRKVYLSAYSEFYRGDSFESNIFMVESGYRF